MDTQLPAETDASTSVADILDILGKPVPETSPQALAAFCNDMAQKIHPGETLASRYGFADRAHLKAWLMSHPVVWRKIEELKAVWESDDNVEARARKLAGLALIEAIPSHAQIMLNPDISPGVRIDAFKETARVAGVAGAPQVGRDGVPGGDAANRFSVQIVFASSGQVESFTTRRPTQATIDAEQDRERERRILEEAGEEEEA